MSTPNRKTKDNTMTTYISARSAAETLGVSTQAIYKRMASGTIQHEGRMVSVESVQAIADKRSGSSSAPHSFPISQQDYRRWVRQRTGQVAGRLSDRRLKQHSLEFIELRRPGWQPEHRSEWAEKMLLRIRRRDLKQGARGPAEASSAR